MTKTVESVNAKVSISSDGVVLVTYESNEIGNALVNAVPPGYGVDFVPKAKMSPTPDVLFGQWIEKTKYLQEEFYGHKFEDFTHQELVEWIRINVLAAEDELHEALGEVSWKPWASAQFFNREAYLGEIVDVLHFIGNLVAGAGITDEELNTAYLEKMERNRQRQREGYTGVAKCVKCKRAVDDIIAHGGSVTEYPALPKGTTAYVCDNCDVKDHQ